MSETKAQAAKRLGVKTHEVTFDIFTDEFVTYDEYQGRMVARVERIRQKKDNLHLYESIRGLSPSAEDTARAKETLYSILRWVESTDQGSAAPQIRELLEKGLSR